MIDRRPAVLAVAALLLGLASVLAWRPATTPAVTAAGAPAGTPDGASLFRAKGCASCHGGPDSSATFEVAPSLAGAATWAGTRQPGVPAEAYLEESIRSPGAFISPAFRQNGPTTGMPLLAVTDAEVAALVAYLLGG